MWRAGSDLCVDFDTPSSRRTNSRTFFYYMVEIYYYYYYAGFCVIAEQKCLGFVYFIYFVVHMLYVISGCRTNCTKLILLLKRHFYPYSKMDITKWCIPGLDIQGLPRIIIFIFLIIKRWRTTSMPFLQKYCWQSSIFYSAALNTTRELKSSLKVKKKFTFRIPWMMFLSRCHHQKLVSVTCVFKAAHLVIYSFILFVIYFMQLC